MVLNKHNLNIAKLTPKKNDLIPNAIRVTPEYTAVTDGNYLLTVSNDPLPADSYPCVDGLIAKDTFEPFNLPADEALLAAKSLPKNARIPILSCAAVVYDKDNPKQAILTNDLEKQRVYPSQPGSFPNINYIIPKGDNTAFEIALDPRKVKALMEQFSEFLGGNKPSTLKVVFKFTKASEAVLMQATNANQTMTGVLMPVRL